MPTHDTIRTALQALQLVAFLGGFIFTIRHLRILSHQYRDLHDWNRRKASQDALDAWVEMAGTSNLINDAFNFLEHNDPLPLTLIQEKYGASPELRAAIHRLLNFFEGLAVGVKHGVYDEALIKTAFATVMEHVLFQFRDYTESRRRSGQSDSWLEAETLVSQWQAQSHPPAAPRPQTGAAV